MLLGRARHGIGDAGSIGDDGIGRDDVHASISQGSNFLGRQRA